MPETLEIDETYKVMPRGTGDVTTDESAVESGTELIEHPVPRRRSRSRSRSRSTRSRSSSRSRAGSVSKKTTNGKANGQVKKSRSKSRSRSRSRTRKMAPEPKENDVPIQDAAPPANSSESNKAALITLYAVTSVNQCCMFIYLGMMPFLYKEYGMDPVTFGYAMSTFAFLTLLSSPILGRIADVFGSRNVLILSMLSASAAHFTMGISGGIPMLLFSRLVSLLMDILSASQMAVTDLVSEQERGRYMGKIMVPMSVGMIVGPTLGGTLSKYLGSQGALMITWIAPLICIFFILTFIPLKKKAPSAAAPGKKGMDWQKAKAFLGTGDIPFLVIMRILATLPGMLFMMNFQLAGINWFKLTPQGNGMVVSTLGCMNMINNWYVLGWLGKRVSADNLVKFTPVLSVATYFLLSQTTEVWHLIFVLYFVNLSYAIMENQVMTRLTKSVDAKDTSTMVGVGTALFHFSRTVSPTLGGILMQKYGWPAIGQLGFVVSIFMASLSVVKYR